MASTSTTATAGSPSGGIPLWNPGEKWVAIAGGACSGTCPVYELYVFDDGRVIFLGKKFTGKTGVMPAKGGRDWPDDLIKQAVDHMVDMNK